MESQNQQEVLLDQTENQDINNTEMSRRSFLKWFGKKIGKTATYLTLLGFVSSTGGSDRLIKETNFQIPLEFKRKKGNEVQIENYILTGANTYLKNPAKFGDTYFDVSTRSFITEPSESSILLSDRDVFANRGYLSSRDMLATPDFLLSNPVFLALLKRTEEISTLLQAKLGGQFSQFQIPQAIATAIREQLVYDTNLARKQTFAKLDTRVIENATDCQEFTALTAYLLAANGIESDVLGYVFLDEKGNRLSHVCNVVSVDGTACVIDTTYSNELLPISEYLMKYPRTKIINNELFFDSVYPNKALPWDNAKWIGENNPIIIQGTNTITNTINTFTDESIRQ